MSTTTQSGTPATLPAGVVLALDVVGTPAAPTTGDGIPYSKLDIGVAGASSPVTAANPLPVTNASLPLPAGASTVAAQTAGNVSLASLDTKAPVLGQALAAFSVPVVLTAAQLATLAPFSSVAVSNFPASQAVTGTFWQATQPVSGAFFQATQPVSIAAMPSTPVTGTFWQATQPVSNATLPLPANAAQETGGNLAIVATNSALQATAANQATELATLGAVSTTPGAFTVLDRLAQLGLKIDAAAKSAATDATLKLMLAGLKPVPGQSAVRATLLHR